MYRLLIGTCILHWKGKWHCIVGLGDLDLTHPPSHLILAVHCMLFQDVPPSLFALSPFALSSL